LRNKVQSYTINVVAPSLVQAGLPPTSLEPFLGALAQGNVAVLQTVPGVSPTIIGVGIQTLTDAYAQAFKIGRSFHDLGSNEADQSDKVWLATIAFGGLAVIASFFALDLDNKMSRDMIRRLTDRAGEKPDPLEEKV
jgi:hypothetical protein